MQPGYMIAIAVALLALALVGLLWRRATAGGVALDALRDEKVGLERQLAIEQQRNARLTELQHELAESRREANDLRDLKAKVEADLAAAGAALDEKAATLARTQSELAATRDGLARAEAEMRALTARIAELENELLNERKKATENLKLRELMSDAFKSLAHEQLQQHSQNFCQQNKEQIEAVLKPLGEKLTEFQDGLHAARREGVEIRTALEEQIKTLTTATDRTTKEAERLAKALRSEPKTQGTWGELMLNLILDASGLRKDIEYETQTGHATEDGRLISDVIVHLPGRGKIVIDSKVSLTAFVEYSNSESEEQKREALARHLASVRRHIDALSAKGYHAATDSGLNFVIMFMPNEGALAAALNEDGKLAEYALSKEVAIATPTTLMIALRTVHSVWQVERRTLNAEQIADRAGKLYDKFANFVEDMKKIGERLAQARDCYDAAYKKLREGNGNLVWQAHQLKELGAKTTKSLPAELLAIAEDTDPVETVSAQ